LSYTRERSERGLAKRLPAIRSFYNFISHLSTCT